MALLAGCGFSTNPVPAIPDVMPPLDASIVDDTTLLSPACATAAYLNRASVCPSSSSEPIMVSVNPAMTTILDTDTGTSIPPGLECAPLVSGSAPVCALAASSITIAAGATLSARGKKPLVLVGHVIDVQGTISIGDDATINASGAGGPGGTVGANRGGFGGGSGGMILFKAGTLKLAASAKIFADGGGGGGGAAGFQGGQGGDPIAPGVGGAAGASDSGRGGPGFPEAMRVGGAAMGGTNGGGGGGGGGGTIWIDVQTLEGAANVSPPPVRL